MASFPYLASESGDDLIRAEPQPDCVVCGARGIASYENLVDRFFGAPGRWSFWRCSDPRCAMLWLNPRPLESDIWKAYRDYYTHDDVVAAKSSRGVFRTPLQAIKYSYIRSRLHYSDSAVTWRERMVAVLAYLDPTRRADTDFPLKYLPYETRGRVLDLGCGSGDLIGRMRAFGWQAEGIDADPEAVRAARRKGLEVSAGTLHQEKFPEASFEAVVMSHVIEHVHHPLGLLKEVRRILSPAGRLVIATPNSHSLGHRMLGARWPFLDPPRHLQVFTLRALQSIVHAAGFEQARVCTEIRTAAAMLPRAEKSHALGRLVEYGENFALHFDREAGEEIALVAIP